MICINSFLNIHLSYFKCGFERYSKNFSSWGFLHIFPSKILCLIFFSWWLLMSSQVRREICHYRVLCFIFGHCSLITFHHAVCNSSDCEHISCQSCTTRDVGSSLTQHFRESGSFICDCIRAGNTFEICDIVIPPQVLEWSVLLVSADTDLNAVMAELEIYLSSLLFSILNILQSIES